MVYSTGNGSKGVTRVDLKRKQPGIAFGSRISAAFMEIIYLHE